MMNQIENFKQVLGKIIENREVTYIVKSIDKNALEYGILGMKMTPIDMNEVPKKDLWEVVVQTVLLNFNEKPKVDIYAMNFSGDKHIGACIEVTEFVTIMISNREHKYDEWLMNLKEQYNQLENSDKQELTRKKITNG